MPVRILSAFTLLLFGSAFANAEDWPQWLGPDRASIWDASDIVESFPKEGLKVEWRVPVGLGYSGPAVVDDKVYVLDYLKNKGKLINNPGGATKLEGEERIQCFSAETGKVIWEYKYNCPYEISYAAGPRCTPTVADGKVYTLGAEGNLVCLNAETGKVLWSKNFKTDYKAKTAIWGHSASPLVDGDTLYCLVGGKDAMAVAFNKDTGEELWRSLDNAETGYCPPTMITHNGIKQLLIWHPASLNSLDPETGKVFWSIPLKPAYGMSVTVPRQHGNFLYVSGIGDEAAWIELKGESKPAAEVVWKGKTRSALFCCNSTPFIEGDTIYGSDIQSGDFIAVNLKDGKRLWATKKVTDAGRRDRHATAFIVKHDDKYFLFTEKGDLILADLSPDGYKEISRFHVLEPTNEAFGRPVVWSHPAFANQSLFARNDKELVRVSLKK
ncbi:PQQ-binding-like beta-propeller repeat protein [uncultured Gimesia sp.]|uniref:PQQ-binding-like beta-propeller repeat protein n=1 Tax=uncultured Gimesia sp. TaxID=1678688 RepID=UPI0030D88851|tara:strand:- start:44271 stop:45590 length:1320 start_codon:yes stop_codon:yes gene_type:complete